MGKVLLEPNHILLLPTSSAVLQWQSEITATESHKARSVYYPPLHRKKNKKGNILECYVQRRWERCLVTNLDQMCPGCQHLAPRIEETHTRVPPNTKQSVMQRHRG